MTYLEYKDQKSAKFWQVKVVGKKLTAQWGKLGAKGQSKEKVLTSASAAKAEAEKLVSQKLAKGYVKKTKGNSKKATATKPTAKKVAKKKVAKKKPPKNAQATRKVLLFRKPIELRAAKKRINGLLIRYWKPSGRYADETQFDAGRLIDVITEDQLIDKTLLTYIFQRSEKLSKDFYKDVKAQEIIANPNVSDKLLAEQSRSKHVQIMRGLARNRRTPQEAFERLKKSRDKMVQIHLRNNPAFAWEQLKKKTPQTLASSDKVMFLGEQVGLKVAQKQIDKLVSWYWKLARSPGFDSNMYRYCWGLFEKFFSDRKADPALLAHMFRRSETSSKKFDDYSIAKNILEHPNVSEELLVEQSRSKNIEIMTSLASNPKTPVKILKKLKSSKDKLVQKNLRSNPSIAIENPVRRIVKGTSAALKNIQKRRATEKQVIPAKLKPKLQENFPKPLSELEAQWQVYSKRLYRYAEEIGRLRQFDESSKYYVQQIDYALSSAAWGWLIKKKDQDFSATDRFGSHIHGQMYTSKEFPWPYFEDEAYSPKIQLDLDKISEHVGQDTGNGLLQLFEDPGPDMLYMLRHIPRNKVTKSSLTDVPADVLYDGQSSTLSRASKIQGFGKKILRGTFSEIDFSRLESEVEEGLPGFTEIYAKEVARFNKSRDKFLEYWKKWQDLYLYEAPTLFGIHTAIQCVASDFDDITLFDLAGATDIYGGGTGCIRLDFSKSKRRWIYDFYGDR